MVQGLLDGSFGLFVFWGLKGLGFRTGTYSRITLRAFNDAVLSVGHEGVFFIRLRTHKGYTFACDNCICIGGRKP